MIVASVDNSEVVMNLKTLERQIERGVPRALLDTGHELLRLSEFEVPHDEGTLQNSGTVEAIGGDVVLGYHTPYAARLHEHPEFRFQKGRKGKYLEDPVRHNADVLGIKFGKSFEQEAFSWLS
jgi:hypothetical protein